MGQKHSYESLDGTNTEAKKKYKRPGLRGRMAGVFRRVSGFFSRSSSRRKRQEGREAKEDSKERKKGGKQKKKKKHEDEDPGDEISSQQPRDLDLETFAKDGDDKGVRNRKDKSSKQSNKGGTEEEDGAESSAKYSGDKARSSNTNSGDDHEDFADGGGGGGADGAQRPRPTQRGNSTPGESSSAERERESHLVLVHSSRSNGRAEPGDPDGDGGKASHKSSSSTAAAAVVSGGGGSDYSSSESDNDESGNEDDESVVAAEEGDAKNPNDLAPIMGKKKKNKRTADSPSKSGGDTTTIVQPAKLIGGGGGGKETIIHTEGLLPEGSSVDVVDSYLLSEKNGLTNSGFSNDEQVVKSEQTDPLAASLSSQESYTSGTTTSSAGDGDTAKTENGEEDKSKGKKGLKHILRRKISATLHHMDLDHSDPEFVVTVMAIPTVQTFSSVKKKLRTSNQEWMQGFLDNLGLERLLDCVDTFANKRVTALSDALILIECVECIRAVLNSKVGVSLLVQNSDYSRRLIKAMDTNNAMVKKQVVELLSALCMYSDDGHRLAMDALDTYKSMKQMRYRFSLIINELRTCEMTPYKTTLMAFINCILCASGELHERNKIRNEFVGLNLLDIIPDLRNLNDKELDIQCDVFDDFKHDDDEELAASFTESVDVTNHKELFDVIFEKVYNTPLSDKFLTILQTLLQIDLDAKISDVQWELMEHAAQTAVVLDDERATKLNDSTAIDRLLEDKLKSSVNEPANGGAAIARDFKETCVQTDLDMMSLPLILNGGSTGSKDISSSPSPLSGVLSPSTGETTLSKEETKGGAPPPPPPPPPAPPPPPRPLSVSLSCWLA
ncbi:protein diaphanous homolog 2, partial [Aplysia californica]|uniref:Protein diaphanous homolog 2 n=1 Tax=Aplysia californica TaxID=6500 RepID=A0ABM1AAC3_APLCA